MLDWLALTHVHQENPPMSQPWQDVTSLTHHCFRVPAHILLTSLTEPRPSRLTRARSRHRLKGGGGEGRRVVRITRAPIGQLVPILSPDWLDTSPQSEDVLDGCKMTTQELTQRTASCVLSVQTSGVAPSVQHPSRLSNIMWSGHTFPRIRVNNEKKKTRRAANASCFNIDNL